MMNFSIENNSIEYIISFMFGESGRNAIVYSDEPIDKLQMPIVIRPSQFFEKNVFGKKSSTPKVPLSEWRGIPILYGNPSDRYEDGKIIVEADIIASAFFLMSRYEEIINSERDEYGRFFGKASLPYKAGFIHRPVIDEYAAMVASIVSEYGIELDLPQNQFKKIYLTHDIDVPWECFTLKSAIRRTAGILKREHKVNLFPIRNWLGYPESDPRYTFKELMYFDSKVPNATAVYFVKSGGERYPQDGFIYIKTKAAKRLLKMIKSSGALIGYHPSFDAGQCPTFIDDELKVLCEVCNEQITISRNHYLCSKEPESFFALIENGIKEDFTMGYADVAGFRLGTCREVRWISPYDGKLTSLVLHPLTVMEGTLCASQYMSLTYEEMQSYTHQLIDTVYCFGGEISLLWHNQSIENGNELRNLYADVLKYIVRKQGDGI